MDVPVWAVALALAALSPLGVRALTRSFEARARRRTAEVLARAGRSTDDPGQDGHGSPPTSQARHDDRAPS